MSDTDHAGPTTFRARYSFADGVLAPGIAIRLQYACYLFFGLLVTMLFRGVLSSLFDNFGFLQHGCELVATGALREACTGEMMVYRVSFALFVFFLLHWISVSDLTCCIESRARAALQERFFYAKSIILVLMFGVTFFIPNKFFAVYAYVTLFASSAFLLMNVLFLVDFSYQWSDDWGERSEGNSKWLWYLLSIAVGSILLGIAVCIAGYIIYVPHSNCNYNAFALTSVVVAGLVYTVISIYIPHGSIVPSSIVFLYTSCIMFVTLRTESDGYCNRFAYLSNQPNSIKQMLFASVVASFTLGYAVVSSGGSGLALNVGRNDEDEDEDPDEVGHLSHYMFFYFVMMLGSMYLAMLATGWHVSGAGEGAYLNSINVAFWVRSVTVWITVIFYLWSLIAPYTCCKDRDFGYTIDDDLI